MSNQVFTGDKSTYTIARELGKGGEGSVYELAGNTMQVLKIYSEPLTGQKIAKLRLMAAMHNALVEEYAAWPADVVTDSSGKPAGFVMKKLADYYPLHMLFSPMDRKKIFPDKGYNFLVHVARNLAAAFLALHTAGLVVGDVNEGNILVNARGMIAFIDCDSFQLKDGNGYHFCEVGVPRYTPPELLAKATFENVVRTVNTDSFSMAVLIFQLLFLGRHPFAGKNNTAEDIDEETAIRQHLFAFSARNKNNNLSPPNDSLSIGFLHPELASLFHDAFEKNDVRPVPSAWIKELDTFLKSMVTCSQTHLHTYPAKLTECIWCAFKEKRNILYFFDDSYAQSTQLLQDIDRFINGFRVEKLHVPQLSLQSLPQPVVQAAPVDKKYSRYIWYNLAVIVLFIAAGIAAYIYTQTYLLLLASAAGFVKKIWPWNIKLNKELTLRKTALTTAQARLDAALKDHNHPGEARLYTEAVTKMTELITLFRGLPKEFINRRKALEERLYNIQLHIFLSRFYVQEHVIPSFGETRKKILYNNGILNAADVSKLQHTKVQGIGPAYTQVLLSWQRQVSSGFVYRPDNDQLNRELAVVKADIDAEKQRLEASIRSQYLTFQQVKNGIVNKQAILKKHIASLHTKVYQADADYEAFKKVAGIR